MSGKAVRETLAALGVIASLVFVGTEIRQNTAVARGQTRQDLAALAQDWLTLRTTNPDFDDLFYSAWVDEAELSQGDYRRATLQMRMYLIRLENVYLQFDEGLIDATALRSYGFGADAYFGARFRGWWSNARSQFDPSFVDYFETTSDLAS